MDWKKILKAYMEQVYQAEGRYACHVQFSGPVDKKLSNEERAALMAINEELTRTHDRWLSIEDNPPTKTRLVCGNNAVSGSPRPVPAGLRILGWHQLGPWAHLELGPWAHLGPITAGLWEPKLCGVLGLCTPMAWLTSICYDAGEGSLALEGGQNVAKKEERTHAGS